MNGVKKLLAYARIGAAGVSWYDDAREYIWHTCEREGWDMDEFINVFAITSPRVSVIANWKGTVSYMESGTLPWGFIKSTRTALKHYEQTHEIRGPKTSAFARALHGDTTALVLDVWMARALDVPHSKVTTKANMRKALARVKAVARVMRWSVRDTQAAIWWGICLASGVRPGNLQDAAQATAQMDLEF